MIRIPGLLPTPMIDLGDLRVAVGRGIGLVQQGHGGNRCFSGFHHQRHHLIHGEILGGGGQRFDDEIVDVIFLKSKDGGMVGIGGDPFETDDQQLAQGADILVCGGQHTNGFGLVGKG